MHQAIKEILKRGDVQYVIGYKRGSYGWRVAPCFVRTPEEVDQLIFSPLCVNNLATYLVLEQRLPLPEAQKEKPGKIGVIVKGCDSRAMGVLLQEHAINREDVVIIGVPCPGVIDPRKLQARFGEVLEPVAIEAQGATYIVTINGMSEECAKNELVAEMCTSCRYPNPVLYDLLIGDSVAIEPNTDLTGFQNLSGLSSADDRWAFWKRQFDQCIRCYACRNVCPVCHCEACMVESGEPEWIRRSVNISENIAFHVMRAFHIAGRCVACGICEHACPVHIPLSKLYKAIENDVLELFDYTAGVDPSAEPLLSTFNMNDPNEGIL